MVGSTAYIALGANLGDRRANLRKALDMLSARVDIDVVSVSDFIETEPVGGPAAQQKYINAAAMIRTTLVPRELLKTLLDVEKEIGRKRENEIRWGSRVCDLDLLLYEDLIIDDEDLQVPHPRMHQRRFVLEPLCQIASEAVHPVLQRTIRQLLNELWAQN